jgi:hypothetical protein
MLDAPAVLGVRRQYSATNIDAVPLHDAVDISALSERNLAVPRISRALWKWRTTTLDVARLC